MTSLQSLPPELLARIISFCSADTLTLARICGVSQLFNGLATPLLYAQFRQIVWPTNNSILAFIRTIVTRPDLARYVKQIVLQDVVDGLSGIEIDEDTKGLCLRRFDDIRKILLNESTPNASKLTWKASETSEVEGAYIPVLVCSLPNLETIIFRESYKPECFMSAVECAGALLRKRQLSQGSGLSIPFSQLRSIRTISTESKYGYLDFDELHPFFNLPSARDFEIALANGEWRARDTEEEDGALWRVKPRSSPVERLSFQYSAMTDHCMRRIVGSCANLKELHFTYGRIHMYEPDFTPLQLQNMVLEHAATLEVLHMNYDDDWHKVLWDDEHNDSPEVLRFDNQLARLSRLRKLSVNFAALFGIGVPVIQRFGGALAEREPPRVSLSAMLPQSLEQLEITCCDHRVIPHLQELADSCRDERFSQLRSIKCVFAEEHTDRSKVMHVAIPEVRVEFTFFGLERRQQMLYLPHVPLKERLGLDQSQLFDDEMLLYRGKIQ